MIVVQYKICVFPEKEISILIFESQVAAAYS